MSPRGQEIYPVKGPTPQNVPAVPKTVPARNSLYQTPANWNQNGRKSERTISRLQIHFPQEGFVAGVGAERIEKRKDV